MDHVTLIVISWNLDNWYSTKNYSLRPTVIRNYTLICNIAILLPICRNNDSIITIYQYATTSSVDLNAPLL